MQRIIAAILLLLIVGTLNGDLLHLKNGDRVHGQIVSQDSMKVVVQTVGGNLTFPRRDVARIVFAPPPKMFRGPVVNVFQVDGVVRRGILVAKSRMGVKLMTITGIEVIDARRILKIDRRKELIFARPTVQYPLWPVLWRSSLLPSWGQFRMGKKEKGRVIAIAAGTFLAGAVVSRLLYEDARDEYLKYYNNNFFIYSMYEKARRRRNVYNFFVYGLLAVWTLNILDAAIFREVPLQRSPVSMGAMPLRGGGAALVSLRF